MSEIVKLNAHQIIDETIEYYKNNPRSFNQMDETECKYLNEDGAMCAVGRCLTDESLTIAHKYYEGQPANMLLSHSEIKLREQYTDMPIEFWVRLQRIHDNRKYWSNMELTPLGLSEVKIFKENYPV